MDRKWAVKLSQAEFDKEYLKRNPGTDVIPSVEGFTKEYKKHAKYHGIAGAVEVEFEPMIKTEVVQSYSVEAKLVSTNPVTYIEVPRTRIDKEIKGGKDT